MGRLVSLIGAPHDPTLPSAKKLRPDGVVPPGTQAVYDHLAVCRQMLADARPDVVVVVGSDHLNQWFMNNMPPFLIGKARRVEGPFEDEIKNWKLDRYSAPIDGVLARQLLVGGYEKGVDFAYSDEFIADHAITIPMGFLRPEEDLPLVPVFINLLAPPLPPGRRYYQVGSIIRDIIEETGDNKRVAVVFTGHFTNAVGSPMMLDCVHTPESALDTELWGYIQANDIQSMLKRATWDQLYEWGNGTPGFLGIVFGFGLARGVKPPYAHMIATPAQPTCTVFAWDEASLNGDAA
jgi:protocatechuate 4,5-dioxygenase, beta chain